MERRMICSGFGGQGILSLGQVISLLAMNNGKNVTWIPAYGAEMRGGTANCSVIYSDELVGSPIITSDVDVLVAMNQPSIDKFIDLVSDGGYVFVNSSVIKEKVEKANVTVVYIDATDIANEMGNTKFQNMIMLGSIIKTLDDFTAEEAESAIKEKFSGKKEKFIPMNIEAIKKGMELLK